ncbi:TetR/AcrR family transcriptional regulator [Amycolatopsis jejuensis]|uniref:TetR/AcrR family transcriptional regulator n=1 Tax=Amycolatopsis jejuensis TaxID=330084 RepID=UPI000525FB76|nr:TetR/AcrR family transcriptional regulator [Amycolatopsis jejuensis]
MTAAKNPNTERSAAQTDSRRKFVEATKRLLAQRPPSAITSKQIAQEAGLKHTLIYHYFDSKESVFLEAMKELQQAYLDYREKVVDRSVALPPLPIDGHEQWWRAAANFSADGGHSYSSLGWTYPLMNEELAAIRHHHPEITELQAKAHIIREISLNFGWIAFKGTLQRGFGLSAEELEAIEQQMWDSRVTGP